MTKRIGTSRRKTRYIMKKERREKGKISISKFFQELHQGDKVLLKAEPAYQKGMYFRRFHGKIGIVQKKRGACYEVAVKDINKDKKIIIHPVHLTRITESR
ncbi:50S ribosomal protein L21e [Candidatus Woesearchaeota archaeon CG_4_10_14_0_8_um_filter_47_5]|nr:MAG: 50S ribosomal protein L21e [Candidatus Woesearchaeota archaeon CG_4_10_14_0_8_um_filter_47_5]